MSYFVFEEDEITTDGELEVGDRISIDFVVKLKTKMSNGYEYVIKETDITELP